MAIRVYAAFGLLACLCGCAVQTNQQGRMVLGLDYAQALGEVVSEHRLPAGDDSVTLRRLDNQYSLKLARYSRVIPLGKMAPAKVVNISSSGADALILVEGVERNCTYSYYLVQVQGSQIGGWPLGDCNTKAQVRKEGEQLSYDFDNGRSNMLSYQFRDSRLFKGSLSRADYNNLARPAAVADPAADGKTVPWYRPAAPQSLSAVLATAAPAAAVSLAKPTSPPVVRQAKATKPATTTAKAADVKTIRFGEEEKRTINIKLD